MTQFFSLISYAYIITSFSFTLISFFNLFMNADIKTSFKMFLDGVKIDSKLLQNSSTNPIYYRVINFLYKKCFYTDRN